MDMKAALQAFEFYRNGSPELRAEIEAHASPVRLEAGQHFCLEGDRFSGFALICEGRIRVYKAASTGRQITLYQVGEGETCLIDMLCTVMDVPSPATAVAHTDVEALLVPPAVFRRWIREFEPMRDYVFRTLSARLMDLMALVEQVAFQKIDRRLASFLLTRRGSSETRERPIEITHEKIAAELGCAREVVSRLLEDFERRGGVSLARGRITLSRPAVLEEITGAGE